MVMAATITATVEPVPFEYPLLSGLLGVTEMEMAVGVLLAKAATTGTPFERLLITLDDFTDRKATVGFCLLLEYGWLKSAYFNGGWLIGVELVKRMRSASPQWADMPDPPTMSEHFASTLKMLEGG